MERELGDYRLLEPLAEGGAGQVFLATPRRSKPFAEVGEPVAVKQYKREILGEPNQAARIEREFRTGSKLHHPNLIQIHEYVPDKERPFLVMEYVDGAPLDRWVAMFHPLAPRLLIQIALRIADGLKALHDAGVVHRDLKPENVMISADFDPKIMDFGVVRVRGDSGGTPGDKFLGTIRNAAPEWLHGEDHEGDPKVDLYALGTILYCLLHGRQVFSEEQQFARLVDAVRERMPTFSEELTTQAPPLPQICKLTQELLQKDPGQRPSTVDVVLERLREAGACLPGSAAEPLNGYCASALTKLSREARDLIPFQSRAIAQVCKDFDIYLYEPRKASDPVLHKDLSPEAVYAMDRKCVLAARLLVVIADHPSFGVGQELEIAGSVGVPAILIGRAGAEPVSRMVRGSFINLVGEIVYETPEDLEHKLRQLLRQKVNELRRYGQVRHSAFPENLGAQLRAMREETGMSTDRAATEIGISKRLLLAIEDRPTRYHNVGLDVMSRILTVFGASASELVSVSPRRSVTARPRLDPNLRLLEDAARIIGLPVQDYFDLRDDYLRQDAASGDRVTLTLDDWRERHAVLEARRLKDAQAGALGTSVSRENTSQSKPANDEEQLLFQDGP